MRRLSFWIAFWLALGPAVALAALDLPAIDLAEVQAKQGLFLGSRVSFWENQSEPLDPAQVFEGRYDSNFLPSAKDIPGPTFIKGELWLRIVIYNPEASLQSLMLESRYALTDHINFYQKDPDGRLHVDHQGDRNESRTDPFPFRSPTFHFKAYPGTNVYYLRTETRGTNILSLYLWREAAFKGHHFVDTLIIGGLFGFLIALFFYNSFLALSLRSRTYAFYTLFLLCMILLQMAMQNVWPYFVRPRLSAWLANEGYVFMGSLTNFSGLLFTIYFLSLKKTLPGFLNFFRGLLVFALGPIMIAPFIDFNTLTRVVSVTVGVGSISMIITSVAAIIRGYQPAAYYLLASVTFLAGNILLTFNLLGIYHAPHVIQYGNFIGVVIQGLLMSLAVGHRVQFIRAQANRLIRGLNEELQNHLARVEGLVAERTETIRTILDNVASGFVIVAPNGTIVKGFSQSCHQLLGRTIEEGQHFSDLLELDSARKKIWDLAWSQIFQDMMPASVTLAQLPSAIKQGGRSLRLECKILRDEAGGIKNLLFTIQDVTELKKQKREARRHRILIKILQDIEAFRQFIHHSYDFINRLKACTDAREQAFLLHTLKGNSMVFGLHAIARRLHELEEGRQLSAADLQTLETMFRDFLAAHDSILKTVWGPYSHHDTRVTHVQLQRLETLVEKRQESEILQDVRGWIQDVLAKPVNTIVQPIVESSQNLAHRLNRPVRIQVSGGDVRVRSQKEEMAMEFLVHILRNAIVHGLDEDRAELGKSPEGHIHVEFWESPEALRLIIKDDGCGFDRNYWEERACEMTAKPQAAISRLSWVELIEVASRGGHSTQKTVSMEAGRGVGLEGVIQAIRELGGQIHLESTRGQGSTVELEIKRQQTHEAA
jgi:signal transduction histidine kinase/large-conductance mechanosensitive channel